MIVGGAQENTLLCCQELISSFHDEVLLVTGPPLGPEGDLLPEAAARGIPVKIIPSLRRSVHPWRDVLSYRHLKRTLQEFRPEVAHTHSAKGGILGRMAAWSTEVPVIVHTVHGAPFHAYQNPVARGLIRRSERYAARKCHAFISVADAMTERMVRANIAHADRFTTVYSGMEIEPFLQADGQREVTRLQLGYQPHHIVVGKIARLFALKGHQFLIEAAQRIVQQNPDVRFLLVGDGVLRQKLEEQIARRGLDDYFQFTGLVEPAQIPALISAMDLLVHTSLREGLARVLPQALLVGRPVISYDIDGAREVVLNGTTGILLPPRSVKALADEVTRLAEDSALRARLAQAGQQLCQERFRFDVMTTQIRQLYLDLLP